MTQTEEYLSEGTAADLASELVLPADDTFHGSSDYNPIWWEINR